MHNTLSPCCFTHHPSFIFELNEFISKHGTSDASSEEAITNIQNLLFTHFYKNLGPQFSAKHFGQAQSFSGYTVYWLHMVIPNCKLSRTQFPKVYFYKTNDHICFLCLDSHIQNYKDSKLRSIAIERLHEILEVLETHSV